MESEFLLYLNHMKSCAVIDDSGKYRYTLERYWGSNSSRIVNFVLLNPSKADATKDDPTVKACMEFAHKWKFDGLVITNLFAFRETSPHKMKSCLRPLGDKNDRYIKEVAKKASTVVVAWGNHGKHCGRDQEVLALLSGIKLHCLKVTKLGQPGHPLYVKRTTLLKKFTV